MLWVKGELLTELDAPGVDPTGQLARESQPSLFMRDSWFARVLAHEATEGLPLVARAASERSMAWLFLLREGRHARALANWYSFAVRPVTAGEPAPKHLLAMVVAMARRIKAARPHLATITIAPVPAVDGTSELLQKALKRAGWLVFAHQSSVSWTANVAGMTFSDYWAARPGQLRNTYKRKLAKARFTTEVYTEFNPEAWKTYEDIYVDSWKPVEGSPGFLRELAEEEGAAGTLRLGLCRIDGEPVATQLWTVENGVALIHKLAHRETARAASPGTILSHAMFRHVIDNDHVDKIDFGTGDDPYKAEWMDTSAPLDTIRAFNPLTPAGLAGATRAWISGLVRREGHD